MDEHILWYQQRRVERTIKNLAKNNIEVIARQFTSRIKVIIIGKKVGY